ncbi:hypothetical protein EVAR_75601_1 [Eumeta japonica]|uniref:Uncharacterized protein n=1 Tax=Eumeta variegata TaxID=151549 RepID=A0A4C1U011_EUMVA|nr:hypothetical protein EVAR_75601_1 [Eumeta japonica]
MKLNRIRSRRSPALRHPAPPRSSKRSDHRHAFQYKSHTSRSFLLTRIQSDDHVGPPPSASGVVDFKRRNPRAAAAASNGRARYGQTGQARRRHSPRAAYLISLRRRRPRSGRTMRIGAA